MIGDVLASTVICEALKMEHPNAEIHYLIQKNTFPVVENNPFIDKIVFFEEKNYKGISGLFKLGKELKAERYDTIIDAYGKLQSLIPTYLSQAKNRIGTHKWYSKFFLTQTVIPDTECNGTANAFRILLAKTSLNKEIPAIFPKIYLLNSEIEFAKKLGLKKLIIMSEDIRAAENENIVSWCTNSIGVAAWSTCIFLLMRNPNKMNRQIL